MSGGGGGNRQDNRQRGNAAQLLEKYKSMARDAQLGGDRVQTEYYLQFADHYFRVLGDSRPRAEDQRRGRDEDGDDGEDDDGMEMADADSDNETSDRQQRNAPRGNDRDDRYDRQDRPERQERSERPERQARPNGRARDDQGQADERIAFDVLPPAIGADEPPAAEAAGDEDAPKPRRRARRPRADDSDAEVAPAV
jgi:hypothetical protein